MVTVKITGGLGNQMFQYTIAKSIAIKNNDNFSLDISFYPKQTLRKYELNFFNIEENVAKPESIFSKIKRKLGFAPKEYYMEKEVAVFDKEVFNYKDNIILDGYWQNENYFKDIRAEILKDFTLKKDISKEANNYLKKIRNNNSVSLHIRRGDYLNSGTNEVHGICDINYYKRAIKYIDIKVNNPIYYIFSDDITWCKENFDFLENKTFVDDTKSAFDDLELMKNCKHNIIANSTFSWWGAWLNENIEKIVISPTIWWSARIDNHIACDGWYKC